MEVQRKFRILQNMPDGIGVEYPARLVYDTARPYEVSMTFFPPGQGPVVWYFSRDLLLRGCFETEPSGEGDVTFHTCDPGKILHMEIHTPYGPHRGHVAQLHLPYGEVQKFLKEMARAVPLGQESLPEQVIDDAISRILDGRA